VWDTLAVQGDLRGCDRAHVEYRLHHGAPMVELVVTVQKQRDPAPESIYVAFPLAPSDATIEYGAAGAVIDPVDDILPGAATDWQAIQDFVAIRADEGQCVLTALDAPLVQLGGIRVGEFRREPQIAKPYVFAWLLNNYWTTNFPATSEGELRFEFALTSSADPSNGFAMQFGRGRRTPLLARILPARTAVERSEETTRDVAWPALPASVALASARPARRTEGVVLLLRELEGLRVTIPTGELTFAGEPAAISIVNAIEDRLALIDDEFELAPRASMFVLVGPRR
jgi:hypothetical protein